MKFFILANLVFINISVAQTRNDVRMLEIKKEHKSMFDDYESVLKNSAETYATSKKPGFYTYEFGEDPPPHYFIDVVINAVDGSDPEYNHILIIRVFCEIPDSIVPIPLKNKTFDWLVKDSKLQGKTISDQEGFLRIRLTSKEHLSGYTLSLKQGSFEKVVSLSSGPYELYLPEKECRSNHPEK